MNHLKENDMPVGGKNAESGEATDNENTRKYDFVKILVIIALSVLIILGITHPSSSVGTGKVSIPEKTSNKTDHDYVSEDGKTVADFSEPVITKSEKKSRLEVYSQNVQATSDISQKILFNWLKKYQNVTYKATVHYYVDLSLITDKSIDVDNDSNTVTITIPKPQYEVDLNYKDFDIGDPSTHTILPARDVKLTFEEIQQLDEEAREKIDDKIKESNNMAVAEQEGLEKTRDIYGPVVKSVDKDFTVNIEY